VLHNTERKKIYLNNIKWRLTVTIQNIDETKLHIIWQLCGLPVKFSSHLTYFECKNYLSFSTSHFSLWHCFSTEGQTTKLCFIPFQFRDIKLECVSHVKQLIIYTLNVEKKFRKVGCHFWTGLIIFTLNVENSFRTGLVIFKITIFLLLLLQETDVFVTQL